MKKKIIIYVLILLFGFQTGVFGQALSVENQNGELIGSWIGYYEDKTSALSLSEIISIKEDGKFQNNGKNVFAQPASGSTHWFGFSYQNDVETPIWLNIFNQGLDYITVYCLNENLDLLSVDSSGAFTKMEDRSIQSHTYWFNIGAETTSGLNHVFIKINTAGMLEVPVYIGDYQKIEKIDEGNRLYGIFFLGAIFIMFCYNLILLILTKDRVYFYYIGYIFFIGISTTFANSFPIVTYILGNDLTYGYVPAWITPSFIFITLFFMRYLKLKERFPSAHKVLIVVTILCTLPGVLNLVVPVVYLVNWFQLSLAISVLTTYVVGIILWKRGSKRAGFFVIAWSLNVCAILIHIAVTNGALPYVLFYRNVLYLGVFFELVVFSVALAERLNELKRAQKKLNKKLSNTNRKLKENNESLDAFNYHVSHDLKTVMNNSNALARMLIKYNEQGDLEKVNEIGKKLLNVTRNGAETVSGFLSLGKVDNVLKNENAVEIPIQSTIERLIVDYDLADRIDVEVEMKQPSEIVMNAKAFESIFLNFFTNTIKYNLNKPKAKVTFSEDQKHVLVSYSDNGVGIDLNKYGHRIFKPFKRGGELKGKEGTGIGLYLVKRIVEFYNGEIFVQSELGKGTTFQFSIEKISTEQP